MKKQLLLTLLLAIIANTSFATNFINGNWRWRNNDGNEKNATWKENQNTSIMVNSMGEILRLRTEVYSSDKATVNSAVLQWSPTGLDPWTALNTSTAINPFAIAITNSHLIKNEATTRQLTSAWPTANYSPGIVVYDRDNINLVIDALTKVYEYEIVLFPTNNMQRGQAYHFRFHNADESKSANIPYASLTVATTLPIILKSFTVKTSAEGNRLTWSTASETNNKYFDLERSTNGITWSSIARIDGNGTTSTASNYYFLDTHPLNGINYYRLAQHDSNGEINYTGVTSALYELRSNELIVYPNPFLNSLNVNLAGYNGKTFETYLTNAQGRVIFQENLTANENGISLQVNQVRQPGVYVLNVSGNGVNFIKQVIVK